MNYGFVLEVNEVDSKMFTLELHGEEHDAL